jgi:chemotaxis protein methyltransferase CheR
MNPNLAWQTQQLPPASQEFEFRQKDFVKFSQIAENELGIHFAPTKQALLYSRLVRRLRDLQIESFQQYYELVSSSVGAEERKRMLDALTTNVTKFFREPHHFEHLKAKMLPGLIDRARNRGRIRIWSAGCSSGQEPYSIALTILSLLPDAASYDIKILATDISATILAKARKAVYPVEELEGIPDELKRRWIRQSSHSFELDSAVRSLVSFNSLNLVESWPMKGPFDIVFCRNVMIYFKDEIQTQIWKRILPLMTPTAVAYIGHSERVAAAVSSHFSIDGITTYRRNGR